MHAPPPAPLPALPSTPAPPCFPSTRRPQDQTGDRPFYTWDASKPGSDLMGAAASALASASLVFKSPGGLAALGWGSFLGWVGLALASGMP